MSSLSSDPAAPLTSDLEVLGPDVLTVDVRPFGARHGRLLMVFSALLFGSMAVAARGASHELPAAQIMLARFAVGLAGVLGVVVVKRDLFHASRPGLLFLRGLFGGLAVLGYFIAIERLSAGLGTLLNYTFPLWAAIFAAIFLGERLTIRVAAGMLLATAGLAVVVGPDELRLVFTGLGDERHRFGLICGAISSVFGGAATTAVRALRRTESALAVFFAFCVGGFLTALPVAWVDWKPIPAGLLPLLILVGVLSFGAQMLFTFTLKYVTAGAGSLTTQLTVVSSYGFAFLFLGEPLSTSAAAGAAIVMVGVLVASLGGAGPPRRRNRWWRQIPDARV